MSGQTSPRARADGYAVEDYDPGAPTPADRAIVADALAVIAHGRGEPAAPAPAPLAPVEPVASPGAVIRTEAELHAAVAAALDAHDAKLRAAAPIVVDEARAVARFARECGAA